MPARGFAVDADVASVFDLEVFSGRGSGFAALEVGREACCGGAACTGAAMKHARRPSDPNEARAALRDVIRFVVLMSNLGCGLSTPTTTEPLPAGSRPCSNDGRTRPVRDVLRQD